jgi:hypothetical protein
MQVTLDGYILGPEGGEADWVDSWADGLELLPPVDAFLLLGGGMFPEYERFWAAILETPPQPPPGSAETHMLASSLTRASPPRPSIRWGRERRDDDAERGFRAPMPRLARA